MIRHLASICYPGNCGICDNPLTLACLCRGVRAETEVIREPLTKLEQYFRPGRFTGSCLSRNVLFFSLASPTLSDGLTSQRREWAREPRGGASCGTITRPGKPSDVAAARDT